MTTSWAKVEQAVRREWEAWGHAYGLFTACDNCGKHRYCRGQRRRRVLCIECYDLGARR